LLWGTYGIFVKSLDYPAEHIIFFRYFFGFTGLLVFVAIKDGFAWVTLSAPDWKWLVLPALFTGVSWLAYTYALKHTFVANAVFLAYTAPVFTVLFAPFIIKEKIEISSAIALVFSLSGTLFIISYNTLFIGGGVLRGDLFALFGGIIGGLIISFIKKVPSTLSGYRANMIISGMIALALLPLYLRVGHSTTWQGYLLLLGMALVNQSLATTMFYTGLRSIKAQHSAVLSYVDPLAATLMASLILSESITLGSLIGGVLIIAGGVLIVIKNKSVPSPEKFKM
jgi:drug/metabolite transporter (DMT)-like permease